MKLNVCRLVCGSGLRPAMAEHVPWLKIEVRFLAVPELPSSPFPDWQLPFRTFPHDYPSRYRVLVLPSLSVCNL